MSTPTFAVNESVRPRRTNSDGAAHTACDGVVLKVFVSFDLAGSTRFKNTHPTQWPRFLWCFYDACIAQRGKTDLQIKLFKYIGDEVVFCLDLEQDKQLMELVTWAQRSLLAIRTATLQVEELPNAAPVRLGVKGIAWAALCNDPTAPSLGGESAPNHIIILPTLIPGDGERLVDVVGPDIDEGFRLGKYSRDGHITLSPLLASLLVDAQVALARQGLEVGVDAASGGRADKPDSDELARHTKHVAAARRTYWQRLESTACRNLVHIEDAELDGVNNGDGVPVLWFRPTVSQQDRRPELVPPAVYHTHYDALVHAYRQVASLLWGHDERLDADREDRTAREALERHCEEIQARLDQFWRSGASRQKVLKKCREHAMRLASATPPEP